MAGNGDAGAPKVTSSFKLTEVTVPAVASDSLQPTMAAPPLAPFFHVKYGFETTPERMFNANVSNAVLLSFVRAACVKDVDDFCKHKSVQLAVELDAIHKLLAARGVDLTALRTSASSSSTTSRPQSGASRPASASVSRPPSGASTTRKGAAPAATASIADALPVFTPEQDPDGQLAAAVAKKSVFERQLEVVTSAARLVKEISARTAWVDLADGNMARLRLDEAPDERTSGRVTLHARYSVVAVSQNELGEAQVTPLTFTLPKYEPDTP